MVARLEVLLDDNFNVPGHKALLIQLSIPGFFLVHWRSDSRVTEHNLWIIHSVFCWHNLNFFEGDSKKICYPNLHAKSFPNLERLLND